MKELKPRIHENGMDYVLVGDYYVPDLKLPEERRPIGHWGRLHQSYLKLHRPMLYNELILSGRLHTVVADLNEQAADRLDLIIRQMMKAEGVTEAMKAENQMLWVQSMNSIRCRAEEIIKTELARQPCRRHKPSRYQVPHCCACSVRLCVRIDVAFYAGQLHPSEGIEHMPYRLRRIRRGQRVQNLILDTGFARQMQKHV